MAKFVELKANAAVSAAELFGGFRQKEADGNQKSLLPRQETSEKQEEKRTVTEKRE